MPITALNIIIQSRQTLHLNTEKPTYDDSISHKVANHATILINVVELILSEYTQQNLKVCVKI